MSSFSRLWNSMRFMTTPGIANSNVLPAHQCMWKYNGIWTQDRAFSVSSHPLGFPRIYTRSGDGGTSALFTGERRPKNDQIFEALGAADELSSHLALAKEYASEGHHPYCDKLIRIQCILQDVSSSIATPKSSARESHRKRVKFSQRHAAELEDWIDEYSESLDPLENFILPGGGKASAVLHICRTVCRKAERRVSPLVQAGEVESQALIYLNRLSDFLFTVARYAAKLDGKQETIYIRPQAESSNEESSSKKTKKKKE